MASLKRLGLALVLTLTFCALATSASASNIVLNPGFETGDFTSWVVNDGTWSVSNSNPSGVTPHSGQAFAWTGCVGIGCIDPGPNGAWFYQDLPTTIGQSYSLSFWYHPLGTPDELQVRWGGNVAVDIINQPNGPYAMFLATVVATSATTRLEFLGRQDPGWNGVDDICVDTPNGSCASAAAVPEPMSLVLLGSGLVGLRRLTHNRKS